MGWNWMAHSQRLGNLIIHSDEKESVILTCEHIFGGKAKKDRKIEVDLFDGEPHGETGQAKLIATHKIERVETWPENDLALIWFKPGQRDPVKPFMSDRAQP